MKFDVKFWGNFPCYVFQGLGVRRKISPKFHVKNGVKIGKFHASFTLLGRSADESGTGTARTVSQEPKPETIFSVEGAAIQEASKPQTGRTALPPNHLFQFHCVHVSARLITDWLRLSLHCSYQSCRTGLRSTRCFLALGTQAPNQAYLTRAGVLYFGHLQLKP